MTREIILSAANINLGSKRVYSRCGKIICCYLGPTCIKLTLHPFLALNVNSTSAVAKPAFSTNFLIVNHNNFKGRLVEFQKNIGQYLKKSTQRNVSSYMIRLHQCSNGGRQMGRSSLSYRIPNGHNQFKMNEFCKEGF